MPDGNKSIDVDWFDTAGVSNANDLAGERCRGGAAYQQDLARFEGIDVDPREDSP